MDWNIYFFTTDEMIRNLNSNKQISIFDRIKNNDPLIYSDDQPKKPERSTASGFDDLQETIKQLLLSGLSTLKAYKKLVEMGCPLSQSAFYNYCRKMDV